MSESGQHSSEERPDSPADLPNAPTEQDKSDAESGAASGKTYAENPSETSIPRQQEEKQS